jgi:hypothetical protein
VPGFRRVLTTSAAALFGVCVLSGPAWAGGNGGRDHQKGARDHHKVPPRDHRKGGRDHHKAPPPTGPTITPIASGLDNPRGLAFGPDGQLYVAEAGHGGTECIPPERPEEEGFCIGFTSGISTIDSSGAQRVVSGLVSFAGPNGSAATGLDGVSVSDNGDLFGIETESSDTIPNSPALSAQTIALAREQAGRLIKVHRSGHWKAVADVGHFDFQWTTEHFKELNPLQPPDANPYGVLVSDDGRWVVDAAANTLDEVRPDGSVSVVAYFPNPPVSDAVPTCLDRGADGALYVGELTGVGNGAGKSIVWRVVPGQQPEVWASGLTAVTGCGFGSDGQFYATEFSTLGFESFAAGTGAVVRVPPHGTAPIPVVSNSPGKADSPLSFPNGFAVGPDGALYVSNWSIAPASNGGGPTGQVVRITQ